MDAKNIKQKENITFYYKKPRDLPDGYMDEIYKLVKAGGSVKTQFVKYNLEKAYLIASSAESVGRQR